MTIIADFRLVPPSQLIDLYVANGWGEKEDYSSGRIETSFGNSTFVFLAVEEEKVVGLIRGFSDNLVSTWIAEILVSPESQKMGIGSALLDRLKEEYGHTSIYGETFRGKEGFFERNGIKAREKMVVLSRRGDEKKA